MRRKKKLALFTAEDSHGLEQGRFYTIVHARNEKVTVSIGLDKEITLPVCLFAHTNVNGVNKVYAH